MDIYRFQLQAPFLYLPLISNMHKFFCHYHNNKLISLQLHLQAKMARRTLPSSRETTKPLDLVLSGMRRCQLCPPIQRCGANPIRQRMDSLSGSGIPRTRENRKEKRVMSKFEIAKQVKQLIVTVVILATAMFISTLQVAAQTLEDLFIQEMGSEQGKGEWTLED